MTAKADALKDLAPTGKLRAAINFGNGVLAQKDEPTGEPQGITPDLARELGQAARRAGRTRHLRRRRQGVRRAKAGAWDIAFVAIEPVRAAEIDFTAPYVLIEGTYMVPKDSPLKVIADVDQPGVRIAVGLKLGLRPLSHPHHQERHPRARAGRRRQGDDRHVRQRQARGRGRRAAAAGGLRQGPSGDAGDGRPLPGDPAGDGHAQESRRRPHRRRGLSARLRRGDEGVGLCRRRAQAQRPDRPTVAPPAAK